MVHNHYPLYLCVHIIVTVDESSPENERKDNPLFLMTHEFLRK
uniref:Uncharacterized protein n=1 Tax=Rhizophora mucronata TaxID=61149 RepID=A0A2P2PPZ9_RHIMU